MTDPILTLPEVAILLKVAEKTVYTMAQTGQIPAFKVRGQWRFKHDDIDQWIDGGEGERCKGLPQCLSSSSKSRS